MNETSSQRHPQEGRQDEEESHTHAAHAGHHRHHGQVTPHDDLVADAGARKDPVCGMAVTADSAFQTEHAGISYYFCSASCQRKFEADPAGYTTPAEAPAAESVPPSTIYTCPMHPEIRQDHPGNCPKCGMALEPLLPEFDETEHPELMDFRRRFWWTLPLTVVTVAMFGHRFGWMQASTQSWVELVLSTPVVVWAGWPFFQRCFQSFLHRSPNMWTLIGLGAGAAYVYRGRAGISPEMTHKPKSNKERDLYAFNCAASAGPAARSGAASLAGA